MANSNVYLVKERGDREGEVAARRRGRERREGGRVGPCEGFGAEGRTEDKRKRRKKKEKKIK